VSHPGGASRLDDLVLNPRRGLWKLALPIIAGMSLHTLYMLTDMAFVGRLGPDSLTALAFNMPLAFLAIGIVFGLGSGITAVIARFVGARDRAGAGRSAQHALALGLVVSAVFVSVGWLAGRPMLAGLGVPPLLLDEAWRYFRVLAGGYPFLVLGVFFRSILAGEGDVRTPVAIQGAGTLLNALLDPLFMFGFDMGIAGAAAATVVSQALATAVFVHLLFFRQRSWVRLGGVPFRFDPDTLREIVAVGAPASFSFVVIAAGGGLFNRILVSYSPDVVAAFQVGQRLDHVVLLPVIGVAASLVTLVGMFHGAGRTDLVRGVVWYGLSSAVAIAAGVGVVFYAAAPLLASLFTEAAPIREAAAGYLRVAVFGYPCAAAAMVIGRALQGMGRGVPVLVLTLLRVILVSAPLAAWGVYGLGRPVGWVWLSIVTGAAASALLALAWLRYALRGLDASAPALVGEAVAGPGV